MLCTYEDGPRISKIPATLQLHGTNVLIVIGNCRGLRLVYVNSWLSVVATTPQSSHALQYLAGHGNQPRPIPLTKQLSPQQFTPHSHIPNFLLPCLSITARLDGPHDHLLLPQGLSHIHWGKREQRLPVACTGHLGLPARHVQPGQLYRYQLPIP